MKPDILKALASMRQRHYLPRKRRCWSGFRSRNRRSFNEAAALLAAEASEGARHAGYREDASMRPRHYLPRKLSAETGIMHPFRCFNEAAALLAAEAYDPDDKWRPGDLLQ